MLLASPAVVVFTADKGEDADLFELNGCGSSANLSNSLKTEREREKFKMSQRAEWRKALKLS